MRLLAEASNVEMLQVFGVTPELAKLVFGSAPWTATDRSHVRRVLDEICGGVLDRVGVPRVEVSAEYVAAVIAAFVHPTNVAVACRWMEMLRPAEDVVADASVVGDVRAGELLVLVCALIDGSTLSELSARFEKKIARALSGVRK